MCLGGGGGGYTPAPIKAAPKVDYGLRSGREGVNDASYGEVPKFKDQEKARAEFDPPKKKKLQVKIDDGPVNPLSKDTSGINL